MPLATLADASQVRHHHLAAKAGSTGKINTAERLMSPTSATLIFLWEWVPLLSAFVFSRSIQRLRRPAQAFSARVLAFDGATRSACHPVSSDSAYVLRFRTSIGVFGDMTRFSKTGNKTGRTLTSAADLPKTGFEQRSGLPSHRCRSWGTESSPIFLRDWRHRSSVGRASLSAATVPTSHDIWRRELPHAARPQDDEIRTGCG